MTHVSLFTGIGGLDLGAEWAGFDTILQVERDSYALRVLEKHWPNVPRINDVGEVTSESVSGPVTVVSGGFPCQPFSAAGKRGGTEDDRYLWPAMLDVIRALTPRWVVAENVPGLLSLDGGVVFETVLSDLEREGYETQPVVVPAAGVGAPHKRDRVFIVAHAKRHRRRPRRAERERQQGRTPSIGAGGPMADTTRELSYRARGEKRPQPQPANRGQWQSEPGVGRVANGVPRRVDRLRALGNAVVPQVAYEIFRAIAKVEGIRVREAVIDARREEDPTAGR